MAASGSRVMREYVLPGPSGGMNTRTYETELPDNNYVLLRNIELSSKLGIFANRRGTTSPFDLIGANAIRGGVRWYYGASSKQLVVAVNGVVKYWNTGTLAWTDIKTGLTADAEYHFAAYLDRLFYVNGTDAMQRWDGTTNRAAGFPAPGSTASVATGAAGVLTGAYTYKITFLYDSNDAHESSASTASATVNPSAQKVDLTSIPTGAAGSGVTGRNIYRTKAGGSEWYFVAKIANNTATTYTDNIADASQGTNQAPNDNGIPPAGQFMVFWRGRMCVAKTTAQPQRLFLSAIVSTEKSPTGASSLHGAGEEIFPASHFVDAGDNNSPITGIAVMRDQLVIFKEDGIYNVQGDDAEDMVIWVAQSSTGCIAPRTIVNMRGNLFFLGRNDGVPEVYTYDGSSAEALSTPIEPTLKANLTGLTDLVNYPIQPCAGRYRGQYILAYPLVGTEPADFECAVLDTRPPAPRWAMWRKLEASVFIPWNGRGDAGEFMYGSQKEGRVLRFDSVDTDYDATLPTNIACTIETKPLDLGAPYQWKQVNRIEVYAKANTGSTITVERRYDFNTSGVTTGALAVTMNPSVTGHQVFKHVIDCGGSDSADVEQGYLVKLLITTAGEIEIYRIVFYFTAEPPGIRHDAT